MQIKSFEELSNQQLYRIMQLRETVFIFEQQCDEAELDDLDFQAQHIFIEDKGAVIAYARFFTPENTGKNEIVLGRFVVAKNYRGQGQAQNLMEGFLEHVAQSYPTATLVLSSQCYAKGFYAKYGFQEVGDPYDEAGIRHIKMTFCPENSLTKQAQAL
ncbi:MAG TPA: GNAT family N-acetyltransferase [Holosporales bacterium]|nr:GNAT family N-acetyltransferase [Holosporales bacterium]